jgi:hypothetical protein
MTQLEIDLRAALHEHAARVHASPKLLGADYRPRTRLLRAPAAIGAGVATAAGALAVTLSLVGGATTAFAGWSPQPTTPTPAQLASAEAYCANHVPTRGLPLKLVDTRGPFTILVYSDGGANDFCTVGPSIANASGWSTSPPVTPPAGRLFLWTDHTSNADGQSYGSVIARAGDGVSAANLTLDDGSVVTATVQNGWAVAWWPGTQHVAAAQLKTPLGTQTQTFPSYPCDVYKCPGGPHGRG